jgi:hypothetical protein
MNTVSQEVFLFVGMVLFAIAGSFVKWINENKRFPNTLTSMGVEACTAAFIGMGAYCVYELCCPAKLAFLLAGFGGWFGAISIEWFGRQLANRFGITQEKPQEIDENSEAFQSQVIDYLSKNHMKITTSDSTVLKPDTTFSDRPVVERPDMPDDEDSTVHD